MDHYVGVRSINNRVEASVHLDDAGLTTCVRLGNHWGNYRASTSELRRDQKVFPNPLAVYLAEAHALAKAAERVARALPGIK